MTTSIYNPFSKNIFTVRTDFLVILLLVFGAAIRFHGLTYSGLWLDEIYSMIGADPAASFADVYRYSLHDQPPLLFLFLNGWLKVFGYSDFAGRSLTCLFGILGIAAMYFLGKQIKNSQLGLFAALITTINFFHVVISKEIRFYPLVFLLTALSFLFFLRAVKNSKAIDFVLYTLFTALLLNTHYFGLIAFATQLIIFVLIIIFFNRTPRLIIGGILSGGIAGASILHYLTIIMSDLQLTSYHVKPISLSFPLTFAWDYIKDPVAAIVFVYCIFLVSRSFVDRVRDKRVSVEQFVVIGWVFFSILIPLIYSLVKVPILTSKYSTIIVPAFFIIIANGFTLFKSERLKSYCVSIVVVSALVMLFVARPPYKPRRAEDWREVARYFSDLKPANQIVFSQHAWFHSYYFKKNNLNPPIDPTHDDMPAILATSDWFSLLLNDHYTDGFSSDGLQPEQRRFVEQEFALRDSVTFKQTRALFYVRKGK